MSRVDSEDATLHAHTKRASEVVLSRVVGSLTTLLTKMGGLPQYDYHPLAKRKE